VRIIAFGCSFTNYKWPTYADILSTESKLDNRGEPGIGNEKIFYNVLRQYKKDKFKNFDVVIVQWSAFQRVDYLTPTGWLGNGKTWPNYTRSKIYKKMRSWYNENYEEEKSLNYMLCIERMLSTLKKKKVIYLSFEDVDYPFIHTTGMFKYHAGDYHFLSDTFNPLAPNWHDHHPTVATSYNIGKSIADTIGLELPNKLASKASKLDSFIRKNKQFINYSL